MQNEATTTAATDSTNELRVWHTPVVIHSEVSMTLQNGGNNIDSPGDNS